MTRMFFTCYSCYEKFEAYDATTPCPRCGGNVLASGYDANLRRKWFSKLLTESAMKANAISPAAPVVMGIRSLWQSEAIELRDLLDATSPAGAGEVSEEEVTAMMQRRLCV